MKKYFNKTYLPAMLGTAIEYYDVSLYGYMAPVLIQVFLPDFDKLSAYFYYFAFEIFAALCQITGAYFFGRIGDRKGRRKAMYYSMIGTSFITFFIATIPTYGDLGIYAALLFASCRAVQSFFLGGEYNGGAIYCLEHEKDTAKHSLISGIYGASTVIGVLIAALIATIIMYFGKEYFRLAYVLSLVFAVLTYYLRKNMQETPEYVAMKKNSAPEKAKNFKSSVFLAIGLVSILCGVLYGFPTRIFNVIIPIATDISTISIMVINCITLVIYAFLLIYIGWISQKISSVMAMKKGAILVVLLVIPAVMLIETKYIVAIILAKLIFTILSAFLIAPLHAWTQSISETHNRYRQVSIAYSLGKMGALLILPITILLFEKYSSLLVPSVILIILALIYYLYIRSVNIR